MEMTLTAAGTLMDVTSSPTAVPAIEGWFADIDGQAHLLGNKCTSCGTFTFPPTATFCPSPTCMGQDFHTVPLSHTGTVWSYTDAQYQPPPPYIAPSDPYQPFAIAAVELEAEGMVVMGQLAKGLGVDDVRVGAAVQLVIEPLYSDDDHEYLVWKWALL